MLADSAGADAFEAVNAGKAEYTVSDLYSDQARILNFDRFSILTKQKE